MTHKKDIKLSFVQFYLLMVVILWIKTYITQIGAFQLGVQGALQHFLLFINPLGSALLFLGLAIFSRKRKLLWLMILYSLLSILLFTNVVFYRSFSDFITWPTIFSGKNLGDMGSSILSLLKPFDFIYFIDVFVIIFLLKTKRLHIYQGEIGRRKIIGIFSLALGMSFLNLAIAETDRPQLLTRGFDRNYIVKYLGLYNYTIYDAVESTRASAQRVLADSNDVTEVINYTKSQYAEPNPEYFGFAEGLNVIYIHLESIEQFLIGYELHGEEVTPFLNSLVEDENTLYFDNFYHQVAQGKTADAEFMMDNSLFGLPQGAAFMTKGRNTYHALPAILKSHGDYTSAVFHGNGGGFWNRTEIYKSFGYDYFFDANYYLIPDGELAEYGLMDKPFFKQSQYLLETLPEPFYAKFITVTNHYPYKMDEEDATIAKAETGDPTVDGYFQTARYADEALAEFFQYLEETGLLDRTLIVMYGDHYAHSENHNRAMAEILGKEEITEVDNAKLQRVPLFIRVPGMEGGIKHEYAGQIDVLPTVLHLLGIDTRDYIHFGTDLLSDGHIELVPFRNGDFVSPNVFSIDGKFYDPNTGLEITDEASLQRARELQSAVEYKLSLSDKVVNGDLLRFHTPEGFVPVDREQFDYTVPKDWKPPFDESDILDNESTDDHHTDQHTDNLNNHVPE